MCHRTCLAHAPCARVASRSKRRRRGGVLERTALFLLTADGRFRRRYLVESVVRVLVVCVGVMFVHTPCARAAPHSERRGGGIWGGGWVWERSSQQWCCFDHRSTFSVQAQRKQSCPKNRWCRELFATVQDKQVLTIPMYSCSGHGRRPGMTRTGTTLLGWNTNL